MKTKVRLIRHMVELNREKEREAVSPLLKEFYRDKYQRWLGFLLLELGLRTEDHGDHSQKHSG